MPARSLDQSALKQQHDFSFDGSAGAGAAGRRIISISPWAVEWHRSTWTMEARRPVWAERRGYVLLVSPNYSLLSLGANISQQRFEWPEYPEPLCPKAARD